MYALACLHLFLGGAVFLPCLCPPHPNPFFKASLRLTTSKKSFLNTPALMALPPHASRTIGISRLALGKNTRAQYSDCSRHRGSFPAAQLSEGGKAGVPTVHAQREPELPRHAGCDTRAGGQLTGNLGTTLGESSFLSDSS